MPYIKKNWKAGETINADALNNIETGLDAVTEKAENVSAQPGPKGDKGDTGTPGIQGEKGDQGAKGDAGVPGIGIKAVKLTVDGDGKVTGGKWTDTADVEHDITISNA